MLRSVPVEVKGSLSIEQEAEVMNIDSKSSWMDPITSYIQDKILPTNKKQMRKLRCQAGRYILIDGVLYRRGYTLPLLQCLDEDESDYVLCEIHGGICGNHPGARSLTFKALRQEYF